MLSIVEIEKINMQYNDDGNESDQFILIFFFDTLSIECCELKTIDQIPWKC